jgi:hypothetical protein
VDDTTELPQVRVGSCGCALPLDSVPVGFRFVLTPTGDRRVAVYVCREHDRTASAPGRPVEPAGSQPPNRRSGRPRATAKAS